MTYQEICRKLLEDGTSRAVLKLTTPRRVRDNQRDCIKFDILLKSKIGKIYVAVGGGFWVPYLAPKDETSRTDWKLLTRTEAYRLGLPRTGKKQK